MNPYKHSELSVKRRGGKIEDYYSIHSFIDCTKEICSDNRHRILHTHWGIRNVIIPIFGKEITNSLGKSINVKDLCEQDHILPDYSNRFIPTISDFVKQINIEDESLFNQINLLHSKYSNNRKLTKLLLSPLFLTGKKDSLILTHNSWFLLYILPMIESRPVLLNDCKISASSIFESMKFSLWMDNGRVYPSSHPSQINTL